MNTPPPARRAALGFIFVTIVLDVLAFGIIIPVLPRLIEEFVGFDTVKAATMYGVFGTVWALMQFFCSPILGALSDRFGRRPVILMSTFGLGLDYFLMALAPTLGWLFVGRILSGMTAAGFTTAAAYIADVTPPEKRAGAFGMVGAAWGLGFILGPAMGGLLGDLDPRLPFWVAGGMTLLNSVYGLFVLPESLALENRSAFRWSRANPIGSLRLLRSQPGLLGLASVSFLYNLSHHVFPSVFVLFAGFQYGWGSREVGLSLAVVGIATTIVQGGLVRPIVKRIGERRALLVGATAGAVGFTAYAMADAVSIFWVALLLYAPAGLFNPSLLGLMSRRVSASEQGQLQGANSSIIGITGLIGPGLFTASFAWFIRPGAPLVFAGAPFAIAAALFAAAGVIGWSASRFTLHSPSGDSK